MTHINKNRINNIKKAPALSKTFNYQNEGLSLIFTLNVDSPKDLIFYKQMLLTAVMDVDQEILRLKKT